MHLESMQYGKCWLILDNDKTRTHEVFGAMQALGNEEFEDTNAEASMQDIKTEYLGDNEDTMS